MNSPGPIGVSPPAQLDALTGIRGIAAWFVVLYHMRLSMVELLPAGVIAALGKGYLAVDLFFMLSGFVMWLNYGPRFRTSGFALIPHFWWKRFARIWPLHAAMLAGLVAFALFLNAAGRDSANYPFAELPLHLLLVQNWGLTAELTWNHPAWSISTEMFAYLMFPFAALILPWERMRVLALAALVIALFGGLHLLFAMNGQVDIGAQIPRFGLIRCLAEFCAGMALCRMWQELRGQRLAPALALLAGVALLAGGVIGGAPETAFVPASLAALLLALALSQGVIARALACAPLRWLGDVSYSTYLAHFPLFIFYKLLFVDADLQLGWWGVAGFLAFVLACSALLYRWLEKPAQSWLNAHPPRFAKRLSPAS